MSPRPPRLLQRILERVVPDGASGPSLLGDLIEEYAALRGRSGVARANLWYAAQVVTIGVPYAVRALVQKAVGPLGRMGQGLSLDLRHTGRALRATPLAGLVAVLSLTLGIGFTTAVTSLVNGIWFAPLPYPGAERFVDLDDMHPEEVCFGCSVGTSYRSMVEWRDELGLFEDVTAMSGGSANLEVGDRRQAVPITALAGNFAEFTGQTTALGRTILPEDEAADAPPVLVLEHGLWLSAFGGDSEVIGRTVRVDGVQHTVVGVTSPDWRALDRARAWTALRRPETTTSYEDRSLWVIGRLPEGVDTDAANMELRSFSTVRYDAELEPGWYGRVRPLRPVLSDEAGPIVMGIALLVATLIVLLVACVNLAALMLSRVTERERELGIRLALGSSRARLARVSVMESLTLATAGGLGGWALARVITNQVAGFTAGRLPGWVTFESDVRVVGAALATVLLTATVCGLLPLLRAFSIAPGQGVIRGVDGDHGGRRLDKHDWLLGAQIVLGVVLVGGGVAAVQSLVRVSDFESLGHRYENLTTVEVSAPAGAFSDAASAYALVRDLSDALGTHPAVGTVVATRPLFLGSWGSADGPSPVWAEGASEAVPDRTVPRHSAAVGPGYLELMEIPLLSGRSIRADDVPGGDPVAVLSRAAATVLWPDLQPVEVVGRRFRVELPDVTQSFTVVGVSADIVGNPRSESRRLMPMIYASLAQTEPALFDNGFAGPLGLRLDVRGDAPSTRAIEDLVGDVDPELAVTRVTTVEANLRQWIMPVTMAAGLMSGLSALALALLMLGVYGTLSYRIASTRHEIGIRIAIGARAADLVRAVTARVGRVLAVAVAVGAGVSIPIARTVGAGEIPLGGAEPLVLFASGLVLFGVAALACVLPVRRALGVDPIDSLKAD